MLVLSEAVLVLVIGVPVLVVFIPIMTNDYDYAHPSSVAVPSE
ncbi:MAG: hypothetical protein ACM3ZC_03260 [Bacteroidota bacterium]